MLELATVVDPPGDLGEHLVGVLVEFGVGLQVELADPDVGHQPEIPHRLGVLVGIGDVLAEVVGDVAGDRPVVGLDGVGQEDPDIAASGAHDDEELMIDGDHPDHPGVTGQSAQLGDQFIEIVGELLVQGDGDPLPVVVVEGHHQVDLVVAGVLQVVEVVVVLVIIVVIGVVVLGVILVIVIIGVVVVVGVVVQIVVVLIGQIGALEVVDVIVGMLGDRRCLGVILVERIHILVIERAHNVLLWPIAYPWCQTMPADHTPAGRKAREIARPGRSAGPTTARWSCDGSRCGKVGPVELHVMDHPLVSHKITLLRSVNTSSPEFRHLVEELVTLLAYEATRHVRVEPTTVQTPIAEAHGVALSHPKPLVVPIMRAGLGMLEGMMRLMPSAEVGFVGMTRDEETLQPMTYAERLPHDLTGRQCFVLDPMLATGGSLGGAVEFLVRRGANHITCLCILAAPEGIEHFRELVHELGVPTNLVVAAVDDHLNERGYIVPGLGDAGDRLYGLAE